MKYQRVNMIITFTVPVGREYYGDRATESDWRQYAEHDMHEHLKDLEDIPDLYRCTADRGGDSFEWLEEFESDEGFGSRILL